LKPYLAYKTGQDVEFWKIEESHAVYWLKVRPEIFSLQTMDGKIVDESGFEYKSFDIFVVTDRRITFQPSSIAVLTGKVLANPRSQTLTLLADSVEFPEENESFDVVKLSELKKKVEGLGSLDQKISWILENFGKYSQIVNRANIAFACFLAHFSPLYVRLNGDTIRGWANLLVIGDSTTGKSATEQKIEKLLRAGAYITAETASQVGLIGSAVQKEQGGWYVDWGFLPLQDRKLLAIDGAHKLSMSNWGSLAESERSGIVTIAKAAKDPSDQDSERPGSGHVADKELTRFLA
jgi:DNA replicative helicase MCM subunit Mcm2 (Cdc46/Mcm family)